MDPKKTSTVFVGGLLVIGLLSACNLGNSIAHQVDFPDTLPSVPDGVATLSNPSVKQKAQPTSMSTIKPTTTAKPTVGSAVTPKQSSVVTNTEQPTLNMTPNFNSKKQGDDLEQQINRLLNDLDSVDTVDDASK